MFAPDTILAVDSVVPTSTVAMTKPKGKGSRKNFEKRYCCTFCPWSGVDNWCLKRHLNTHMKPYECVFCEYKAARAERLATHVFKVHSKRMCCRCSYIAQDQDDFTPISPKTISEFRFRYLPTCVHANDFNFHNSCSAYIIFNLAPQIRCPNYQNS